MWILTGGNPDLEDPSQEEPVVIKQLDLEILVETTNYIRYNTVAEDAYFVSKFTNNKPWGQLVNKQAFFMQSTLN